MAESDLDFWSAIEQKLQEHGVTSKGGKKTDTRTKREKKYDLLESTMRDSIRNDRGDLYDDGYFGNKESVFADTDTLPPKSSMPRRGKDKEIEIAYGAAIEEGLKREAAKKNSEADMVRNGRGDLYDEGDLAPEDSEAYRGARKERLEQATEADMVRKGRGDLYDEGEFAVEGADDELPQADGGEDEDLVTYPVAKSGEVTDAPDVEDAPKKAKVIVTPEQARELFRVTHGGDFDPKSSMDKKKMKEIEETLAEQGGLGDMTPNRFALNIYRKYKYV